MAMSRAGFAHVTLIAKQYASYRRPMPVAFELKVSRFT